VAGKVLGRAGRVAEGAESGAAARAAASGERSAARDAAESCAVNSFTAATTVLMADGSQKPISQVKEGDQVRAGNPENHGQTAAEPVKKVIVGTGHKHLVDVSVPGDTIQATYNHPFWVVDDKRFVWAQDLKPGQHVLLASGATVAVRAVHAHDETTTVYNLSIRHIHTFFVGRTSVLVHNSCGDDVVEAAVSLPVDKATRTTGILDTGLDEIPIVSGMEGRAALLEGGSLAGGPGMNGTILTHVEANAASFMRQNGIKEATLYISKKPCDWARGCEHMLPHMLPPGARLTVVSPGRAPSVYIGNGR